MKKIKIKPSALDRLIDKGLFKWSRSMLAGVEGSKEVDLKKFTAHYEAIALYLKERKPKSSVEVDGLIERYMSGALATATKAVAR